MSLKPLSKETHCWPMTSHSLAPSFNSLQTSTGTFSGLVTFWYGFGSESSDSYLLDWGGPKTYGTDLDANPETEYTNSCTYNYQCNFFLFRLDLMILKRENPFLGPLEGVTQKFRLFWAQMARFTRCHRPSLWIFPHQNPYVPRHINNRYHTVKVKERGNQLLWLRS
jgi:hypothetical protein